MEKMVDVKSTLEIIDSKLSQRWLETTL
jgi:hypothetical protein